MDGFLDTTDARRSFLPKEKKLEILKDPRAGAFAVIGCGTYLLFYAALFSELDQRSVLLFSGAFLTERALSGMSVVSFPMAKKDGLAASFSQAALKRTVRLVMALYLAAGAAYFLAMGKVLFGSILPGWLCILAAGPCSPGITGWPAGNSAESPGIWRDISCRSASFFCWPCASCAGGFILRRTDGEEGEEDEQ